MKRFVMRRFINVITLLGFGGIPLLAHASAFQLFEQDASSVGNYHAGYAAKAEDASTNFYNPAGIVRIKTQEVVFGGNAITPSFKYVGDISVNTIEEGAPIGLTAQGGAFAFVPFVHYVAPITDAWYFGFSVDAPFGLKTNYGHSTPLKYAATLSAVTVVDISPALAFQWRNASFGVGFDIQRMMGEFDSVGTFDGQADTDAINRADDTAYGYHLGVLYEFTPTARIGLSYHSQVVHHLSGTSKFIGPLADAANDDKPIISRRATTTVPLPPYTALSGYYRVTPCMAVMASVIYTQWSLFDNLILNGVAGLNEDIEPSTNIQVVVPSHYRNSWNFSLGADFMISPFATVRTGIGYDQSPVKNIYRNIQLPDNNRYILALGGHYQFTDHVGADFSWLHVFIHKATVHPSTVILGAQQVRTNGYVTGGADVLGGQIVWDML